MSETLPKKHSKLGIASTLLGLAVWIYFVIILLILFKTDYLSKLYDALFPNKNSGLSDIWVAVLFLLFIFIGIPALGHLVGFILGIIATISPTKKRLFGIIGIILNVFPFLLILISNLFPR